MYPENPGLHDVFFFFDEIQYIPEWEAVINRVHEQVSRKVIITGSNSKTLHTEVASVLRGRGLPLELWPLSFAENLQFRNIPFKAHGTEKAVVLAACNDYQRYAPGKSDFLAIVTNVWKHLYDRYILLPGSVPRMRFCAL